jgi:hypothetical protein
LKRERQKEANKQSLEYLENTPTLPGPYPNLKYSFRNRWIEYDVTNTKGETVRMTIGNFIPA